MKRRILVLAGACLLITNAVLAQAKLVEKVTRIRLFILKWNFVLIGRQNTANGWLTGCHLSYYTYSHWEIWPERMIIN